MGSLELAYPVNHSRFIVVEGHKGLVVSHLHRSVRLNFVVLLLVDHSELV